MHKLKAPTWELEHSFWAAEIVHLRLEEKWKLRPDEEHRFSEI